MFGKLFKNLFSSGKGDGAESKANGGGDDVGTATAADRYRKLRDSEKAIPTNASPEKLCGIVKGMSKEEIEKQLTTLYRRHNRAASSLDANLREEAEAMLDAIVELRMKYLSPAKSES